MKRIIYSTLLAAALMSATSCSDFLDRQNPAYDSEGFFTSEAGLKEGVTGVYALLTFDQNWLVPAPAMQDNYTAYGLEQWENTSIGAGGGLTPDQSYVKTYWTGQYNLIARANSVISGASEAIDEMSDAAKQYYAEARVLRAFAYYNLVSAYGDVPFFTAPVTIEEYTVGRTDKQTIVDFLIEDLDDAAQYLPWTAENRGRIDRAVAYGLISRIALFAGSFDVGGQAREYFTKAADYAEKVFGQRGLATNYKELFTLAGQKKSDVRNELLFEFTYSTNDSQKLGKIRLGISSRTIGGSSVRFPSTLMVDTYECKDGLRIDESPLYDPKHPTWNRDPRFAASIAGHGDTVQYTQDGIKTLYCIINTYDQTTKAYPSARTGKWYSTTNMDVTQSTPTLANNGVGFVWRKYADETEEAVSDTSTNLVIMRYAEILLNYAEAKIELGELDSSVVDAINQVRRRAGMPDVSADRIGNIDKMRQLVRRERKVEFAMEGLLFVDVRRWGIGDILNESPTYGQPLSTVRYEGLDATDIPNFKKDDRHDLNDVACYDAYADKLRVRDRNRFWASRFTWWPIPRTECDRDPNLTNPEY